MHGEGIHAGQVEKIAEVAPVYGPVVGGVGRPILVNGVAVSGVPRDPGHGIRHQGDAECSVPAVAGGISHVSARPFVEVIQDLGMFVGREHLGRCGQGGGKRHPSEQGDDCSSHHGCTFPLPAGVSLTTS